LLSHFLEKNVKLKTLLTIMLSCLFIFVAHAQDKSTDDIKARIMPVGSLHIAGAQAEVAAASGPRSGADVYGKSCVACHGGGIMGAPKLGDATDWSQRLSQGMETVLSHAINGFNAMPPKGTCGNCSDAEIKAAIEHMIAEI
jgi:cytochrome c5